MSTPGSHASPASPTLRVLAVMPSLTPEAGAETSWAAVAPALVARGIEVHLALLGEVQLLAPALIDAGVTVHDLSHRPGLWRRVRDLRALMGRIRPDLVHPTHHVGAVPSQLAAASRWRRVLVTWASTPTRPGENPRAGRWKLGAVRMADIVLAVVSRTRFHAVTAGVARVNGRWLFVPRRRIRVAERGRDAARFAPRPAEDVASLRTELGLAERQPLVLSVGRQDLSKAQHRLLAAVDEVAATHPEVVLALAGRDGSASERLRHAHAAMAHPDAVRFLGHRDDVAALLQVAQVVVCSSVREGAAGALIEAMASGTPIVTVPLEGLEGVLTDGDNAVVVPPERLAEGIRAVLDAPDAARRRAERARRDFLDRFTLERSAEALAEVYRWAAPR